jgi:nitroimidazol reductase NimA-like FMN-containing flavoprotein (pyridoxamine 5'-phosphate oxidase superfamily)
MNLTERTELCRLPCRGSRDWETIKQSLDAGFLAHWGFCVDGQPFVITTSYGRDGERLYLHGSAARRTLRGLETGIPTCVMVTPVGGLVLSRSAFDHSMNYRSVVAFETARRVLDSRAENQVFARYLRTSGRRPMGESPSAERQGTEGDNGARILNRGGFIEGVKWAAARR